MNSPCSHDSIETSGLTPQTGSAPSPASSWAVDVALQVQFFDLDPMDIVWHGNYVKYLEIARCALFDQIAYNYTAMEESGYSWPIIDLHVRYARPAVFGQRINVHAAIVEWENRLKIDYLITDESTGQRLTRASTVQVAVHIATNEMCFASPSILLTKLGISPE